jgi:uncharacterized SAM-binding protein YcdF (DUF218 family)
MLLGAMISFEFVVSLFIGASSIFKLFISIFLNVGFDIVICGIVSSYFENTFAFFMVGVGDADFVIILGGVMPGGVMPGGVMPGGVTNLGIDMVGNENRLLLELPQCSITGFLCIDNIVINTIHNSNSKYIGKKFILYTL